MPTKMRLKKLFCFTNAAKIQRDEWSDCGMKDEHDRRSLSTESSEFNVTADEESESVATTKSGSR